MVVSIAEEPELRRPSHQNSVCGSDVQQNPCIENEPGRPTEGGWPSRELDKSGPTDQDDVFRWTNGYACPGPQYPPRRLPPFRVERNPC